MKRIFIILSLLSISVYAEEPKQRINHVKEINADNMNKEIINRINDNFVDIVNKKQNKMYQLFTTTPTLTDLSERNLSFQFTANVLSLWTKYNGTIYQMLNSTGNATINTYTTNNYNTYSTSNSYTGGDMYKSVEGISIALATTTNAGNISNLTTISSTQGAQIAINTAFISTASAVIDRAAAFLSTHTDNNGDLTTGTTTTITAPWTFTKLLTVSSDTYVTGTLVPTNLKISLTTSTPDTTSCPDQNVLLYDDSTDIWLYTNRSGSLYRVEFAKVTVPAGLEPVYYEGEPVYYEGEPVYYKEP